ncbi:MAG: DUF167 family protein [Thermodesulfobacteriota bacterium]|nr:DUF167 family protein [Thermodesulfobacteriota bacterium]
MTFLREEKGSLSLALHIQPRASKNRIVGLHGENLKLAVTAPPADGKANKAVVKFLADFFAIPKREVTIKSGLQSRKKRVLLSGISLAEAWEKIDIVLNS